MAFNEQGFIQAARAAGYSDQEIGQAVGSRRTGLNKWLFGNRTSLPGKAFEAVSNVLNLPSYAIGGLMNKVQGATGSQYAQGETGKSTTGIVEGIKNKRAVFSELPESLNVDPNSGLGMALGFAGELATPDPIALVDLFKGANSARKGLAASRKSGLFSKGIEKAGTAIEEGGKGLAVRALRPSPSQIERIEKITGKKLGDFIAENDLYGSGEKALGKVRQLISDAQAEYNALVRNGRIITPEQYADALRAKAKEIRATSGAYEDLQIARELEDRATVFIQSSQQFKNGVPVDFLTNTKSGAYRTVSPNAFLDPTRESAREIAGDVGVQVLDRIAPGSADTGKRLQALRTFENIASKQRGIGKGTQPINILKLGGATAGGVVGGPTGALAGYIGEQVLTHPRFLSSVGQGSGAVGGFLRKNAQPIGSALNTGAKRVGSAVLKTNRLGKRELLSPVPPQFPQSPDSQGNTVVPQFHQTQQLQATPSYTPIRTERLQGSGSLFNPYKRVRLR